MILSIKTNRQYSKSFLRAIRRNLEREILININFMKLLEYSQELGIFFKEEIDCYKAVKQAIRSFKIISEPSCINFLLPSKVRL